MEAKFKQNERTVSRIVDSKCVGWLTEAEKCREMAKNPVTPNDREAVVAGLKHLREITDFHQWVTADVRGKTAETMQNLKKLVNENEWPVLLARAGFNPTDSK